MTFGVLDPTNEKLGDATALALRLTSFEGKMVGFVTNGKEGTKGYFGHLDRLLRTELGVKDVVWRAKANYSAPAAAVIVADMRRWDAVITGVGD
jgi:hypothetical protein